MTYQLRCPKGQKGKTREQLLNVYVHFKAKLNKLRYANVDLGINCKVPADFTGLTLFDNDGKWHSHCIVKFDDPKGEALLKKAGEQAKQRENEAA